MAKRPRRRPALEALATVIATGTSYDDAARVAGVSQRVLSRHRDEVERRVMELRSAAAGNALSRLSGALERAVATLENALSDEKATSATRARAAATLVSTYLQMKDVSDTDTRLDRVERHLELDPS